MPNQLNNYDKIIQQGGFYTVMEILLGIIPIFFLLLFYLVPVVFIVWFVLKIINIQKEQTEILLRIADKLEK
ncbi:hypothetical protein [Lysinibacillus sphaericus]|uniref:hypothetical protein n=1 Tax=Lysinibacillus sphaericus TaxID=1421 RepID=UPI0018AF6E25|nr:hypothetical protein [Lysinibacillus sphaericus]QPA61226.1 hypothetical protein INQ55_10170 [Lysinibacillus sphaericus]